VDVWKDGSREMEEESVAYNRYKKTARKELEIERESETRGCRAKVAGESTIVMHSACQSNPWMVTLKS
jgi:hypothetical protein